MPFLHSVPQHSYITPVSDTDQVSHLGLWDSLWSRHPVAHNPVWEGIARQPGVFVSFEDCPRQDPMPCAAPHLICSRKHPTSQLCTVPD